MLFGGTTHVSDFMAGWLLRRQGLLETGHGMVELKSTGYDKGSWKIRFLEEGRGKGFSAC